MKFNTWLAVCMLVSSTSAAEGDCAGLKRMDYTKEDCSDEGTANANLDSIAGAIDKCLKAGDNFYKVTCDKTTYKMDTYKNDQCAEEPKQSLSIELGKCTKDVWSEKVSYFKVTTTLSEKPADDEAATGASEKPADDEAATGAHVLKAAVASMVLGAASFMA